MTVSHFGSSIHLGLILFGCKAFFSGQRKGYMKYGFSAVGRGNQESFVEDRKAAINCYDESLRYEIHLLVDTTDTFEAVSDEKKCCIFGKLVLPFDGKKMIRTFGDGFLIRRIKDYMKRMSFM